MRQFGMEFLAKRFNELSYRVPYVSDECVTLVPRHGGDKDYKRSKYDASREAVLTNPRQKLIIFTPSTHRYEVRDVFPPIVGSR
jgi:hypothetical protein